MKILQKILIILILIQCSCSRRTYDVPDHSNNIKHASKVTVYSGNEMAPENIIEYKYFNTNGQLIESVELEYRDKYIYDSTGLLIEKYRCRGHNCDIGLRILMIYDDNRNLIGDYSTLDKKIDLDTIDFFQEKFYDQKGRIAKETAREGKIINGEYYTTWRSYSYNDSLIYKEFDIVNNDTTWIGTYSYDDRGNLVNITRIYGTLKEEINYNYDKKGQLIKESIKSNESTLTKNTAFSVKNNTTFYAYDSKDRLISEITLNHKGEIARCFIYRYQ